MSIFKTDLKNSTPVKIFLVVSAFMVFAPSAHALLTFDPFSSYNSVNDLTTAVVNWFLSITAGVTIFFLIMGGVYYLTAFGDDKRMQEGKKIITYAVYGLLLILISYSVVVTLNKIIFE